MHSFSFCSCCWASARARVRACVCARACVWGFIHLVLRWFCWAGPLCISILRDGKWICASVSCCSNTDVCLSVILMRQSRVCDGGFLYAGMLVSRLKELDGGGTSQVALMPCCRPGHSAGDVWNMSDRQASGLSVFKHAINGPWGKMQTLSMFCSDFCGEICRIKTCWSITLFDNMTFHNWMRTWLF